MGTGLGHYIPLVAYLGFIVMTFVSLTGRPLYGLYYLMPFLPYRTMRDHFLDYPLGGNVLTILALAVVIGAILKGKRLPPSKLYGIWLGYGFYLYLSMWLGTAMGNAPAPLWLNDITFVTWKDYMLIPLLFVAAGMVVEDRKAVRTLVIITAFSLLMIDRSALMESLSRSFNTFDESKRDSGPLGFGSNQTAAFLAQFAMFFWAFAQFVRRKWKLMMYGLVAVTLFATMYTFSRAAYLAVVLSIFVLGLLKDRKLLLIGTVFLLTWQAVVPASVSQRVNMTHDSSGNLEASAQERVLLLDDAKNLMASYPIFGMGYATYQLTPHAAQLRDTHNWYLKVMVETGAVGVLIVICLLQQMLALCYRLFRRPTDPLYKALGLGLFVATCSCMVANLFGDRWTYLEINGLLWVLMGAATRSLHLAQAETQSTGTALPALQTRQFPAQLSWR